MFTCVLERQRGFTLIELLVTITVVAIIASLAAPSFSGALAGQQLNTSVRELAATFGQARSQAALLRREVTVTLNDTTANTSTNFYWSPVSGNTLTAPTPIPVIIFTANGTIKSATDGTAFSNTDFVVCNTVAKITKTITLTRMGTTRFGADGACS